MIQIIISFIFFLLIFLIIGIYSATRRKETSEDYLLASRNVNPWLMALSAVSTNNSGFMFIGLIGATYKGGISSIWIMVGWIIGDFIAWLFVHKRLREKSENIQVNSIPNFLGTINKEKSKSVTALAGLITLIFLGTYAAAQLNAGSKALHVLFGWNYASGALIGAVIVLAYSFSGGIRASIWTDAVQSIVMIFSMTLLISIAIIKIGGLSELWLSLEKIDPNLTLLMPQNLKFGFILYLVSWHFAGLGVAGQPHIIIRAMVIRHSSEIKKARTIYFTWYIIFTASAILVGLASRILLPEMQNFDAELALPQLSMQLMPAVLVGLILAGLFAATMSTADSQVISCSAALSYDIFPQWGISYFRIKMGTLFVTIVILCIALFGDKSVFKLVVIAWSALASSLGPLMIVQALGLKINKKTALAMISGGITVVLLWRYGLKLSGDIYDVLPGMVSGFLIYLIGRQFSK